jgi:mono/diheme cytochrome c family protein
MRRLIIGTVSGVVALGVSALALAGHATPGKPIAGSVAENFTLTDQQGVGHTLYYHAAQPAVVIVTAAVGDPASERAIAKLSRVKAAFAGKNVEFFLLDSKAGDSREAIDAAGARLDIPLLADELQLVGRSLGVTSTAEAFVVNPKTWMIAYHGPVDGVADALSALIAGKSPAVAEVAVKGTPIAFPDRAKAASFAKISYAKEVAPILSAKCVVCHTDGGMGPFAMNSYEVVKGFSPMIREVLRTKRMPPFHADPHYGAWKNDMSLSAAQVKTIVNWVEAGAPRGAGEDPLKAARPQLADWPMGKPDVIVKVPAFDVPASGLVDYQDRSIPTNLTEGKWLRATAWKGASPTVHHALAGWIPEVRADGRGFSWNTSMGGYGPGGEANLSPPSTGTYLPPGGSFAFQMHYTTTGKPVRDETEVGLYFYKEEPKYILRQASVTDFSIELPAGASRHKERAYLEFPHDALLFGTQPHCHSRCYSTKLTLRYPDGKQKVLLNQPRYEFGWQREYLFKELLPVPAGSVLIAEYVYDNSAANVANPDPKHDVVFGEQTSEEMLFTFVRFRWKDETSAIRRDDYQKDLQNGVMFGALDDNMDGKLQKAEFRNAKMFAPLKANFALVDKDKDGAVDKAEMQAAQAMMRRMRGPRNAEAGGKPVEAMTAAATPSVH